MKIQPGQCHICGRHLTVAENVCNRVPCLAAAFRQARRREQARDRRAASPLPAPGAIAPSSAARGGHLTPRVDPTATPGPQPTASARRSEGTGVARRLGQLPNDGWAVWA